MRTLSPFTQCTVVKQMKLNTRSTKSTANALECDGLSNSEKNPSQVSGLFRPGGIWHFQEISKNSIQESGQITILRNPDLHLVRKLLTASHPRPAPHR